MKNDVRFVRYQYIKLDYYSASSLKQQPTGRHVAPLGHIFLITNQPIFALTHESCMLSEKQLVPISYGLWFDQTVAWTLGEHANHYATNVIRQLVINK